MHPYSQDDLPVEVVIPVENEDEPAPVQPRPLREFLEAIRLALIGGHWPTQIWVLVEFFGYALPIVTVGAHHFPGASGIFSMLAILVFIINMFSLQGCPLNSLHLGHILCAEGFRHWRWTRVRYGDYSRGVADVIIFALNCILAIFHEYHYMYLIGFTVTVLVFVRLQMYRVVDDLGAFNFLYRATASASLHLSSAPPYIRVGIPCIMFLLGFLRWWLGTDLPRERLDDA